MGVAEVHLIARLEGARLAGLEPALQVGPARATFLLGCLDLQTHRYRPARDVVHPTAHQALARQPGDGAGVLHHHLDLAPEFAHRDPVEPGLTSAEHAQQHDQVAHRRGC